jgi:hypothetical protein
MIPTGIPTLCRDFASVSCWKWESRHKSRHGVAIRLVDSVVVPIHDDHLGQYMLTESIVEDAALSWLGELGYAPKHGPEIAPGELHAERTGFGETVLAKRLRDAVAQLKPREPVSKSAASLLT